MSTVNILSLDGGGIRGIIPAQILAEIEKRCDKPIARMFDLIAGTSTGGILALALSKRSAKRPSQPQYSAAELIDFYFHNGPHIFEANICHKIPILQMAADAVEPRFPVDALEDALREKFGNMRLSETLVEVLIPSYDLRGVDLDRTGSKLVVELDAGGTPVFFARSKALEDPKYFDFYTRDVARATSAAPTYFKPFRIRPVHGGEWMEVIDGGVFANNPAMCAYTEAIKRFGSDKDFVLVSVGTGELSEPIDTAAAQAWGELGWVRPLLTIMMDGVSKTVHHQLQNVLRHAEGAEGRYFRLQPELAREHAEMSDASEENMELLRALAIDYIAKKTETIDTICTLLQQCPPAQRRRAAVAKS